MLERRCRCIRINYNDGFAFHLDVTPAIPDWNSQSTSLYVPDRTRKVWCSTHPIGFADAFFKPVAERMPVFAYHLSANSRRFSENTATVEPLPTHGAFDKTPLQRVVQLVKHDRDKYYEHQGDLMPSSILLTTLVARSYDAAVTKTATSLFSFVHGVIADLPRFVGRVFVENRAVYRVENPANPHENFADRWTDLHYKEFKLWHAQLVASLQALEATRGKGVDIMLNELSSRYGQEPVKRAANSLGVEVRQLHEEGQLRMNKSRGAISAVGAVVPGTINFGGEN
jgi:hypothetical protein